MPSTRWLAPLALLVAATTWGLIWYPYRVLLEAGVSGAIASVLTYLAGLPVLLILAFRARVAEPDERRWLLALAIVAGWTNLAYVLAVIHGEVMRVMLLFYLAPLWTVGFARLLLGERVGLAGAPVIVLSLAGAWVMLSGDGLPLPANYAEWLALSAGMAFALTNVLTRRIRSAPIALRAFWVFTGVAVISTVYATAEGATPDVVRLLDGSAWAWVAFTGALLLVATFSVQFGLAHTPANQAIVILLFELVVAAVAARLLAGEVMDAREWIGGAMIVAATLFSGRLHHEETDKETDKETEPTGKEAP